MTPRAPSGRSRLPDGQEQLSFDFADLLSMQDTEPGRPGARRPAPAETDRTPPARPPAQHRFVAGERISAERIAELLGRDRPTAEQIAVIEAGSAPLLVVAGAGSGKTETMAARVVWLVANGLVAPEQVLGLTFTRKAAAELADRVRLRLAALRRIGFRAPGEQPGEDPQPVTVSTYHAYAASILTDHGLRLGLETGNRLVGEAGAWQIVDELVERWDGDMTGVDAARSTVVDAVLSLAGECAEHLVTTRDIDVVLEGVLDRVAGLPAKITEGAPGKPAAPVRTVLEKLAARRQLLPIVEAYLRRKRELEVLDFGDQVALGARVAREVPEVGAGERARFQVVLLDEYQDTSHAQLSLLRSLFGGGHPVTAVGDPHQSIYGWRGASAGNLQRFPIDFPDAGGAAARPAHLSTSWRNDAAVLEVANQVAGSLRAGIPWAPHAPTVSVPPLQARPGAGAGQVQVQWHATVEDEAAAIAELADKAWGAGDSVAVLCRARSQFPLLEAALRVRGLPVEVVGLGGLLHVPEVADLRAALEVLHDASRGDAMMRLLTGAAWRLGPRDLDALGAWARTVLRRVVARRPAERLGETAVLDDVDELSLVEALDRLPEEGWTGPSGEQLSPSGRRRLSRLAGVLRHLRSRTALALPELVAEVERALLLDIEVAAVPGRRPAAARANLDAFMDVAAAFADAAQARSRPTLGAFLAWLAAAESEERGLEAPVGQVQAGAVQLLTVHAAKGLEWDVVAVPGLVEGTFPNGHAGRSPTTGNGWLNDHGALPYPIRGDVAGLPHWRVESAGSQQELARALEAFRDDCGAYDVAEERRLAYVAMTRARRSLLLTGAVWGDGTLPRTPSRFLLEVADLAQDSLPGDPIWVQTWQETADDGAANPRESLARAVPWPIDPVAGRREALESGAALVRAAMADPPNAPDDEPDEWSSEIDALLAERDAGRRARREVVLPLHLSASQMVSLAADPDRLADRLRRPMPQQPNPQTRRGSTFHAWLEQRFAAGALVDVDELPGAADDASTDEDLAALQQRFLASAWAERVPEAVEVAVETPVAGRMLRGRIDAVFRRADGGWDVVDWKTGVPPSGPDESAARAVQLAVYRLAWSALAGVDLDRVGAAFFYAATGETVRPVDLLDAAGLAAVITDALAAGE